MGGDDTAGRPGPPPGDAAGGADPREDAPTAAKVAPATPLLPGDLSGWERFRVVGLLGEGGMGTVYRAQDPRLDRTVALKFIRGADAEATARFVREAQAQARIEHDNVCRIYEVGEALGHPYIAMQYIEGKTLGAAQADMSLEQRVRVLTKVARAVHAAHRVGLIHRDLKPGNVMVELAADGDPVPYVLDFGLARRMEEAVQTATGAIVGTPAYMAPEQARGDPRAVDRRTDVYALGVMLYEALTGRPPFGAGSSVQVLMSVLGDDPLPPRAHDPAIPADLQTITLKCLEKDPTRRYDSARALAEDLRRYLDGEPIEARRSSLAYRLARKGRKHRAAVATGGVGLLVAAALLGLWVHARRTSAARAALAQRFGQQVESIEALLRVAHSIPRHDIRPEKAEVRARMQAIETQTRQLGDAATGVGAYALGRGHLALEELDAARERLEAAWDAGWREPEAAYALGLALGGQYQTALEDVERIRDPETRETRRREAQTRYRDPALRFLRVARAAAVPSVDYVDGLIAFYEGRHDDALAKARSAAQRVPWLYEARLLEGQVHLTQADVLRHAGRTDEALEAYALAEEAIEAAARIGESAPRVHEALCALGANRMRMKMRARGEDLDADAERTFAACAAAVEVDPESAGALARASRAYTTWAGYLVRRGRSPSEALARAEELARRGVAADPTNVHAHNALGNAASGGAEQDAREGRDPRAGLAVAASAYEAAIALDPGYDVLHNNLGVAYAERAQYESTHGLDPTEALAAAVSSFEQAARLNPRRDITWGNSGFAGLDLARHQIDHGRDGAAALDRAEAGLRQALALNPAVPAHRVGLGDVFLYRAEAALAAGAAPEEMLATADDHYAEALAADPGEAEALRGRLAVRRIRAEAALLDGGDPSAHVADAAGILRQARSSRPDAPGPAIEMAKALLLEARFRLERGRGGLDGLVRAAEDRLGATPDTEEAQQILAEASRLRAEASLAAGRPAGTAIRQGLARIARALELRPEFPPALACRGALHLLAARAAHPVAERREAAERARGDLSAALARNGTLRRAYGSWLEESERLARADPASGRDEARPPPP